MRCEKIMRIKAYRKKDKKRIFDLFESTFKRKLTNRYWNWRFCRFGIPIRYLMWEKDDVIGHYVVHPIPLKIKNRVEKILFSMSVMTHPDFKGRGIFPKLASQVYEKAKGDYKLVIGFPNQNSSRIHFEKIGWSNLGKILEYQKEIKKPVSYSANSNFQIKQIDKFDAAIDLIWKKYRKKFNFIVPRTSEYLNWRFIENPKKYFKRYPSSQYFSFIILHNKKPEAYFVLKKFGNKKCHLVDYFGDLNYDVLKEIIYYSIKFCYSKKIKFLSFWIPNIIQKKISEIIQQCRFKSTYSDSYFGIRILNPCIVDSIKDPNQWFITMCDSDVF